MAKNADKQLKKLGRQELLEMLIEQTKANEALSLENADLISRLEKAEADLELRDDIRSAFKNLEVKLDEIVISSNNTSMLDKLSMLEEKTETLTNKISELQFIPKPIETEPAEKETLTTKTIPAGLCADDIIAKIIAERK